MDDRVVLFEEKENIAILTLNRPHVMNAVNFQMAGELAEKIGELRLNRKIRVAVITGAGDKAFCAGADLKERTSLSPDKVREFILMQRNLFTSVEQLNKPVIAAINGIALGGGTELALACDIRIAADTAQMGLPETRLAIIPGGGGTQRLPRIVGRAKAKELIFTGRRVEAREALSIGLVNRVCTPDALLEACIQMARTICEAGPIAIEQAKYAIDNGIEADLQTGLAIESNAYWVTIPTKDRLEGLAAFRERRKPVYKGE